MKLTLILVAGYLCGCFNIASIISKLKGAPIAKVGNGNPGASNVTLHYGFQAGIVVALCDILKVVLAGILAHIVFDGNIFIITAVCCLAVVGHIFPVQLRFRGGKGFASFIGLTFVLDWKIALVVIAVAATLAFITDYIVAATFTTILLVPWYTLVIPTFGACIGLMVSLVSVTILIRHRENIKLIILGEEPQISSLWLKPKKK